MFDFYSRADNMDSNQTARMHSLISIFVGRTCQKISFSRFSYFVKHRERRSCFFMTYSLGKSVKHKFITKTRLFKYMEIFTTKN